MKLRINEAISEYKKAYGKITKVEIAKKVWKGDVLRTQKSKMNNLSNRNPICIKFSVLTKLCEVLKTTPDKLIR